MDSRFDLLLRYSSISLQRLHQIKDRLLEMTKEDCDRELSSSPRECGTRIISSSEAKSLIVILRSISDMSDQVRKILEKLV
jgi:formyltetrahydrofolate synthetase